MAAHKLADASNVRGGERAFAGERALDGDPNTYWATDDGVTKASLDVDLETPQEINVAEIEEAIGLGGRMTAYKVEGFVDGVWRLLSEGTGGPQAGPILESDGMESPADNSQGGGVPGDPQVRPLSGHGGAIGPRFGEGVEDVSALQRGTAATSSKFPSGTSMGAAQSFTTERRSSPSSAVGGSNRWF